MRVHNQKTIIGASLRLTLLATAAVVCPALAWAGSFTAPTSGAYRLAFVTSGTIAATSADIATYNSFVTNQAALNGALPSTNWTAIASTASTDAVTNTACSVAGCASDPIYLVDGTELATSLANFFADSLLSTNGIAVDQNGQPAGNYVWTGSNAGGTAATGNTLGTTDPIVGLSGVGNGMNFGNLFMPETTQSLYAISAPIDAATNVPEPASAALLITGVLALAAGRRRRSKATA